MSKESELNSPQTHHSKWCILEVILILVAFAFGMAFAETNTVQSSCYQIKTTDCTDNGICEGDFVSLSPEYLSVLSDEKKEPLLEGAVVTHVHHEYIMHVDYYSGGSGFVEADWLIKDVRRYGQ